MAARLAALHATEAEIAALRVIVARNADTAESNDDPGGIRPAP